jgi:hypothetical protein
MPRAAGSWRSCWPAPFPCTRWPRHSPSAARPFYALRPAKLNAATAWIGTIIAPAAAAAEEAAPQDEQQIQQAQQHIAPSFVPDTAPPVELPVTVAASALASEPAPASEPDAVPPALPAAKRQKVEKAAKQPQVARPEPAINQMGFDF